MLTRKRSILIKRQAVLGTLETLLAANGIGDVAERGFIKPDLKRISTDNLAKVDFGHPDARYDDGAAVLPFTFAVPVYKPVAAGALPGNGVSEILAGICGLAETVNAGVSVVYTPQTPADLLQAPRASLDIIEGSDSYPMLDARGTAVLSGKPGADLLLSVDVKSPFALPTANATPPVIASPAGQPMRFAGAVVFLKDGTAIDIGSLDFDIGGESVEHIVSSGVNILIKNRLPTLKIPTHAVIGDTKLAKIRGAASFTLKATWSGLVLDLTARLSDVAPEDRDGTYGNTETFEVLTYSLTFS